MLYLGQAQKTFTPKIAGYGDCKHAISIQNPCYFPLSFGFSFRAELKDLTFALTYIA